MSSIVKNELDCSHFKGRLREICLGQNITPAKRAAYLARWQGKSLESMPAPTSECIHRGELLEIRHCNLCGIKGQPFEVFACGIVGECSIGRKHSKVQSCATCADRSTDVPLR